MTKRQKATHRLKINNSRLTLLGTAHVSRNSAAEVGELLASGEYDTVAVELCPSRYKHILDPDTMANMDLFRVLREGKTIRVIANLALGSMQQRIADEIGVKPGLEMHAAINCAREKQIPVWLIDRDIGTTLTRIYRNIPWWQRITLMGGLLGSVLVHQEVSEEEIEKLKEGDILEATLSQFAEENQTLFRTLIGERDEFMSARLRTEINESDHRNILVVVGAGHLAGLNQHLEKKLPPSSAEIAATLAELERIPENRTWLKALPWLVVALILAGFAIGFSRSPSLGQQLIIDWVLINGGLSALGTLLALGHPLTIVTAFVAAPLTSLNPMIGAGMVTAMMEVFLRKPLVRDFDTLRSDVAHYKGWWKNRVSRTLLVFLFSTLGSVLGTYIAGYSVFQRIATG